ncbi:MAG: MBOAT family protein [Myxococcota bacterium]|jgi:D-alanyl-lipoteichoic acid acyltransferase DltB (MBOAT superfamily)
MLFNSLTYLAFFFVTVMLHFALPHRFRWMLLLAASYGFYASWNAFYLVLIVGSTLVDFTVGRRLGLAASDRERRALVVASLVANLGLLFVFKYWNFFGTSANQLAEIFGLPFVVPSLNVLLPVGISFYTFQTLSYTLDIYRGDAKPEPHLGRFAVYVAFFPQLVAGPIERASRLLPQMSQEHSFDVSRIRSGLELILWGLFKKVVIADRVSLYVDAVYNNVGDHTGSSYLIATYLFAIQIYCDFSAYSDIAIGSAKVLGFDLMENFRRPYFSQSMTEFWRRWHISLSTWLRDYLYIPLGGNRGGAARTYLNLGITMLLGGIWHGASWNFVIWGAYHGILLALSRSTLPVRDRVYEALHVPRFIVAPIRMLITFHLVCLGWIFFRAATLSDSVQIITGIPDLFAGKPYLDPSIFAHGAVGISILLFAQVIQERFGPIRDLLNAGPPVLRWAVLYLLIFLIITLGVDGGSQFIYFQF